jgi:hypothetical protein
LGSRESHVCVRNGAGDIVERLRCRMDGLIPWLARRARARVVGETCTEAFRMAAQVGDDVCVVAATLVGALGVRPRGLKNDRRGARTLGATADRRDKSGKAISSVPQLVPGW